MIAIVTDTTAYLTKKEAHDLNVHVVPMNYAIAGRIFQETYADSNGDYQKYLINCKCTTSQPSPSAFMSTFAELRRQNYHILCIVMSSRLSGAYSSAVTAAREIDNNFIRVVDSRTIAGGMKFLILRAKELIEEAGVTKINALTANNEQENSLENIALTLERERDNIAIGFTVESLAPLRNSGRIGFIRQSIGTILNTRPIFLCADGAVVSHDYSKGSRRQIQKLVGMIPQDAKKIIIHYIGNEAVAAALKSEICTRFADIQPEIMPIGPVLGIHLGIPAFGVAWKV